MVSLAHTTARLGSLDRRSTSLCSCCFSGRCQCPDFPVRESVSSGPAKDIPCGASEAFHQALCSLGRSGKSFPRFISDCCLGSLLDFGCWSLTYCPQCPRGNLFNPLYTVPVRPFDDASLPCGGWVGESSLPTRSAWPTDRVANMTRWKGIHMQPCQVMPYGDATCSPVSYWYCMPNWALQFANNGKCDLETWRPGHEAGSPDRHTGSFRAGCLA